MGLTLLPHNITIDFVKQRYWAFVISFIVILGSLGFFFLKGLNYGVDFQGGALMEIRTAKPVSLSALRKKLSTLGIGGVKLQELGSDRDILIRFEHQISDDVKESETLAKIKKSLGEGVEYRRVETVGPKVSEDLKRNALMAVVFSLVAMLIYIWFRFEWQFGLCAVIALVHDCLGIIGLYALTFLEFNETAIIAILTTAGYSINDTVVIYDRIRENMRKFKKMPFKDLINRSISETLSRTMLTSFSTLLALIALYLFGGQVISTFSLPIICGISIGTYSSIYLASLLLYYFNIGGDQRESLAETS